MNPQKERLQPRQGLKPQKQNTHNKQFNSTGNSCQPHNSAATQRQIILAALRNGSLTTLEIRQKLGICHPAARCMELRRLGFAIETIWVNDLDSTGKVHRVARYVLG